MNVIKIQMVLVMLLTGISLSANNITKEEQIKWANVDVPPRNIQQYKNLGVNTPEKLKEWKRANGGRIDLSKLYSYVKEYGVSTPKELIEVKKKDKELSAMGVDYSYLTIKSIAKNRGLTIEETIGWAKLRMTDEMPDWIEAGITNPKHALAYKKSYISAYDAKSYPIKVEDLIAWQNMGVDRYRDIAEWNEIGIKTPDQAKKWLELEYTPYNIKKAKEKNLGYEDIKGWGELGIKKLEYIEELKQNGFNTPSSYIPYKGIYLGHSLSLKKWNIKPDNIIASMSYGNSTLGVPKFSVPNLTRLYNAAKDDLYFSNKDNFLKAYNLIKANCKKLEENILFSDASTSNSKNKCYIFSGKMFQRLDEKSMFSGTTQKGLVKAGGNKLFFVDNFKGSWQERKSKIGIIKATGSYSYKTRLGAKKVVPKGSVIYLK